MAEIDTKPVFMVTPSTAGGMLISFGIPEEAWTSLQEGNSFSFDMEKAAGMPIQIQIFKGADHTAVMAVMEGIAKARNIPIADMRREDFAVAPTEPAKAVPAEEGTDADPR